MTCTISALLALSTVTLATGVLDAQEPGPVREATDARHRSDCRLAAQVLTTGHPAPHREWALSLIDLCDESGPPVLAQMWEQAEAQPDTLAKLVAAGARVPDRRLYSIVRRITLDASEPPIKRAAGLSLLGRWASPGFSMHFRRLEDPSFAADLRRGIGIVRFSHDVQIPGADPLPSNILVEVFEIANRLTASESHAGLRALASELASQADFRLNYRR
jgi:hypothetical protein